MSVFLKILLYSSIFKEDINNDTQKFYKNQSKPINVNPNPKKVGLSNEGEIKCNIPEFDPFSDEVMEVFHPEKPRDCSSKLPLIYAEQDLVTDIVYLHINETLINTYLASTPTNSKKTFHCCYQKIYQDYSNGDANFQSTHLQSCKQFNPKVMLLTDEDFVLVQCTVERWYSTRAVYKNAFSFVRHKRIQTQNSFSKRPISVLLIGIDNISRLHIMRAMPKTYRYLKENHWIEYTGYNKIGECPFTNLMAVLAGLDPKTARKNCFTTELGMLDKCPIIWKEFRQQGYTTAYAEDGAEKSTFAKNNQIGFNSPPVDYYFRPFTIAAERHLYKGNEWSPNVCLGNKYYADYIYRYGIDFAKSHKETPYFGLFWTSTFSRDYANTSSIMDEQMRDYFEEMHEEEILENSLVIFLSDHGIRFGATRHTMSGFYEERLPFLFISVPTWLKESYPEMVENIKSNQNRLTTPYDMHATLKHILAFNQDRDLKLNCDEMCRSFFEKIPINRTCETANIEPHWCTCPAGEMIPIEIDSKEAKIAVNYVMEFIDNRLKQSLSGKSLCSSLGLNSIRYARKSSIPQRSTIYYLVQFDTTPGTGIFEATVTYDKLSQEYNISGTVSRLSRYLTESHCVADDWTLKKFCVCSKAKISLIIIPFVLVALSFIVLGVVIIVKRISKQMKDLAIDLSYEKSVINLKIV